MHFLLFKYCFICGVQSCATAYRCLYLEQTRRLSPDLHHTATSQAAANKEGLGWFISKYPMAIYYWMCIAILYYIHYQSIVIMNVSAVRFT